MESWLKTVSCVRKLLKRIQTRSFLKNLIGSKIIFQALDGFNEQSVEEERQVQQNDDGRKQKNVVTEDFPLQKFPK